jgi:hypothetical protein
MQKSTIKNLIYLSVSQPKFLYTKKRYILLLSHMRSYTTVLSNILGSHNEIDGYVETHMAYNRPIDLFRLKYRVCLCNDYHCSGRYVLDKVLHNKFSISKSILEREDVIPLFTIRHPIDAIRSLIAIARKKVLENSENPEYKIYADPSETVKYYKCRLYELANISRVVKGKGLFFEAEKIINEPGHVLASIKDHLGLKTSINATYSKFKYTGVEGFGDPSRFIMAGKIIKNRDVHSNIIVPDELFENAMIAYEKCKSTLINNCIY